MFCNGIFVLPTENVEQIIEEQWECARHEPTVVAVYFVTEINIECSRKRERIKYINPHKNYCVFNREQAIRVATEVYREWQPIEPTKGKISKTHVEIKFSNEFVAKQRIVEEVVLFNFVEDTSSKRFLRVVK